MEPLTTMVDTIGMDSSRVVLKNSEANAVQITRDNISEVMKWSVARKNETHTDPLTYLLVLTPQGWKDATFGDWVLEKDGQFEVFSHDHFTQTFETYVSDPYERGYREGERVCHESYRVLLDEVALDAGTFTRSCSPELVAGYVNGLQNIMVRLTASLPAEPPSEEKQ